MNLVEAIRTGRRIRNKNFPRHAFYFKNTVMCDYNGLEVLSEEWEAQPEAPKNDAEETLRIIMNAILEKLNDYDKKVLLADLKRSMEK